MDTPMIRVLLIEDDEDDYTLTWDLLHQIPGRSYRLDWVRGCDDAQAALRRGGYDVALIDQHLQGCTGLELVEQVQALGCPFPLLLLTALRDPDVDHRAMKAGVSDFLLKSTLDADRLDRAIRYAIEHKRAENERRQLHAELEQRVRDRTAELEAANRSLQAEVAERTRLEGELRRRMEQMAEEDQRKNEFLDVLGHELRNPLAPIVNALEITRRNGETAGVSWAHGLIERQVRHLIRLVDDLLDISRISHGTIALRRERTALAPAWSRPWRRAGSCSTSAASA
jgi:signal transduction histidine kinase